MVDGTVPVAFSTVAVVIAEVGAIGVGARASAGALSTAGAGRVTANSTQCGSVEPIAAVIVVTVPRLAVDSVARPYFVSGPRIIKCSNTLLDT